MPYLSKLTKRLACARSLAILAVGIAACTPTDRTATDPAVDDSLQARNSSTNVASVVLSPSSATGSLGQSAQFTALAENTSGGAVTAGIPTWSSSDSTIVAVTQTGMGTAVGVGQATLTATINGVRGTAQTTVTGDPIASIALSPSSAAGSVGQQARFTATLTGVSGATVTGRRVIWTSSNPTVVSVDSTGFATGIANGTATIVATSGGKTASANVTVGTGTQAVTNPAMVTDLTVVAIADTTATLSFTQVNDGTGQPATYEIRDAVAPIAWGTAGAVTRGTCASPMGGTAIGTKISCTVNGLAPSTAYNFQLVAFRGTLGVSAVFGSLSAVAVATTIATVSQSSVASVAVTPGSASGAVGQGAQFSATVKNASGTVMAGQTIAWTSTNTAVVTVNASGYATAVGAGSAAIVASAGGKSGQAAITVTGAGGGSGTVSSTTVSPSSASIAVGATQALSATLKDVLGNILGGLTTTWSSSNTSVATVSSAGVVKGMSAGTATITATSGGMSGSSTITVSSTSGVSASFTGWANAPSSYPTATENPFNALDALNWRTSWNTSGLLTAGTDQSAVVSPSGVLQFSYPIGFVGSKAPAMEYFDFPTSVTHFYSGISWKANANWQGNSSNVNKLEFVYLNGGAGDVFLCAYGQPGGPYEITAALEIPTTDSRDLLVPNVAHVPFMMGGWHQIEWQVVQNTTTNPANGILRWWVDGTLVGEYTDINFPAQPMEEFQISPTWGGGPDVKTQNDFFWFDHAIVKGY